MSFFEVARQDPTLSTMLKLLNRKVVDSTNAQNKLTDSSLRQIQFPNFETLYINATINYERTIAATQTFTMPTEPDGKNCVAIIDLVAIGNPIEDQSGFNNDAFLSPKIATIPDLVDGKPGTYRPANTFDGKTIWYYLLDVSTLRLAGLTTGFSIWMTVNPSSLALSGTAKQTLCGKRDDASNAYAINLGNDGFFRAGVTRAGVETKFKSTVAATVGNWYDIVLTYSLTGPTINLYVNKVSTSTTADAIYYPTSTTDKSLNIGRATDPVNGLFSGTIQFFRFYRDLVLSQTQVNNLFNNLWTIENIASNISVAKWGEFRIV